MKDDGTAAPQTSSSGPDAEAEGTGETVGEAKWTALRELERRFPTLDKSSVEFVVLSEGERGLLGVGFVPARVVARAASPAPVRETAVPLPLQTLLSPTAERLRELLGHIRVALQLEAEISVSEDDGVPVATFHGPDLGLVIGKHGQTIDAIQYLAKAVLSRGAEGPADVVIDAAGYRSRRRALLERVADQAADRVASTGSAVSLEPMTAAERKIVHVRLSERGEVVTSSDGVEPNRYVVIQPGE